MCEDQISQNFPVDTNGDILMGNLFYLPLKIQNTHCLWEEAIRIKFINQK